MASRFLFAVIALGCGLFPLAAGAQDVRYGPPLPPTLAGVKLPEARVMGLGLPVFNPISDHHAATDGVTDATAAIAASLADCSAAGGGVVTWNAQLAVTSANITIPQFCTLGNPSHFIGDQNAASPSNESNIPAIILSSSYTVNVGVSAALDGIAIFRQGMTVPSSLRSALTGVSAFAGTAVTFTGGSSALRNAYIVGFNKCYASNGYQRLTVMNVRGDCTNGSSIIHANDWTLQDNVEFWCFYNCNSSYQAVQYAISGAADNGSGKIQMTVATPNILQAGDLVISAGIVGFTGGNGRWTVESVNAGTVVLTSSASAPTKTATFTGGEYTIGVASTSSLGIGQTISGTGISGGATISYIDHNQKVVWASQPNASSQSGVTLTFGNGAYTSGGTLTLDATIRQGVAFYLADSQGTTIRSSLVYGYDVGAQIDGLTNGGSNYWNKLIDFSCDKLGGVGDPIPVCVKLTGASGKPTMGVSWIGGYTASYGTSLYHDAANDRTSAQANTVQGVHFAVGSGTNIPISNRSGNLIISDSDINQGSVSASTQQIATNPNAYLALNGNDFHIANILYVSVNAAAKLSVSPTTQLNGLSSAENVSDCVATQGSLVPRNSPYCKVTASASASFAWTNLTQDYYHLRCYNVTMSAASTALFLQFGEGATPTWGTGLNYLWAINGRTPGGTAVATGSSGDAGVSLNNSRDLSSGYGLSGYLQFFGLAESGAGKSVAGTIWDWNPTAASSLLATVGGGYTADTNPITAVRLFPNTGTVSGGPCWLQAQI